jgi:hypothetical protein
VKKFCPSFIDGMYHFSAVRTQSVHADQNAAGKNSVLVDY